MSQQENFIVEASSSAVAGVEKKMKHRGKTKFLSKTPTFDKNRQPTLAQEEHLDRFSSATAYARAAMADPALEKIYSVRATKERSVFNLAVKDYIKVPKVKKVDVSAYTGNVGSTIQVFAKDDFAVKAVKVSIRNAAGDLVEEGNALIDPLDKAKWVYTATQVVALLPGSKIKAVAQDIPGNAGELEITL
jgi:hypothetical protein